MRNVIVLALVLSIGAFLIARMREGDDFAMYIHHANYLAHSNAYSQTGYIYDPHCPDLGPGAYPPLFSLFLAPVYWIMGMTWA